LKETGSSNKNIDLKKFGRFSNWTSKAIKFLPRERERLVSFVYNCVLTCDNMGLLAGFGMSNKHKDKIPGNPEKNSIYTIPVEIPVKKGNVL
jgi:hypothetical protein